MLKDKYDGCCENSDCEAFDNCTECLDEWAERNPPTTNADRIRAMSDDELAVWISGGAGMSLNVCGYCKDGGLVRCDGLPCRDKTDAEIILEWLKQPAGEEDA